MKIVEFDRNGFYHFHLENFNSVKHAHPAVEIIAATKGTFSLTTNQSIKKELTLAVIDKNVSHSVNLMDCEAQMIMLEHVDLWLYDMLQSCDMVMSNGIYTSRTLNASSSLFLSITENTSKMKRNVYDDRVTKSLKLIEAQEIEFGELLTALCNVACLSESRISHLFKDDIGISPKKYLVWNKLKKTIKKVIFSKENLFSAGLEVGFYDQAHLSKAFKGMLGVPPSLIYNSRILQI